MSQALPDSTISTDETMRRHFWRNYLAHSIEGGLASGGMAFIAADTIAPPLIKSLGGPTWLISLTPVLFTLGIMIPPLFTAHKLERLQQFKPLVLGTALLGRLLFLIAGLILLLISPQGAGLAIVVVVGAQFLAGLCNGTTLSAWQGLVAKTVPHDRLSSMWAARYTISTLLGILAGGVVAVVLAKNPGLSGFGMLYLIAFGFGIGSAIAFSFIYEPKLPVSNVETRSLVENLRRVPGLVRNDRRLSNYILSSALMNGSMIMIPFMSIHSLQVTGMSASFLGLLVSAQMVGAIGGNVIAGLFGNRNGGIAPMFIGRVLFIVTCLGAMLAHAQWQVLAVFVLYGMSSSCNLIGSSTMNITLSPSHDRTTYLSIISAVTIPCMLIASALSTVVWNGTQSFSVLGIAALGSVALSTYFLLKIGSGRAASAD